MFLKNTAKKDIKLASFEGFSFIVPPGVSAIWTPAGEQLLKVHKVESKGVDKFGLSNGHGVPALYETTEAEWRHEGRMLVQVSRFKVAYKLIPRVKLIVLAGQRGIDPQRVMEYQLDASIEPEIIAEEIHALPISDMVKYPVSIEDETDEPNSVK
mgnify:CR=1 FL=1